MNRRIYTGKHRQTAVNCERSTCRFLPDDDPLTARRKPRAQAFAFEEGSGARSRTSRISLNMAASAWPMSVSCKLYTKNDIGRVASVTAKYYWAADVRGRTLRTTTRVIRAGLIENFERYLEDDEGPLL